MRGLTQTEMDAIDERPVVWLTHRSHQLHALRGDREALSQGAAVEVRGCTKAVPARAHASPAGNGGSALNPESLAATRWKSIRQAHEQIAKAQKAQTKSQARLQGLRAQIGPVELRDRTALGQALVDGKAEPASEAVKLKAALEQEERNAEALALAVQSAHGQVGELVAANRREWRKEAMRELSRQVARYKDAITDLEDAREALSSEATLVTWLDSGAGVDAATDLLGGRLGTDASGRPPMSFARTLEELRADAERLARYPATHDDPPSEPRLELAWGGRG